MDAEIKNQIGELTNLASELKDFSQNKYSELEEKGAEMGQTLEKVNNMVNDLDAKMKTVEKRMLKKEAASAEVKGAELELKEMNLLRSARNQGNLEDVDQYMEAKAARDKALTRGINSLSHVEHKALNSVIDPDGGYLIVPQYGRDMINRVFEARQVMGNVSKVSVSGGVYKEYVDFEDYNDGVYQDQLSAAPSDSNNIDYDLLTLIVGDHYYAKDFHRSFLEDVGIDIQSDVMAKIDLGMTRQSAGNVITGDGSSSAGHIRGINTYANGTDWKSVEQITSATNDAFGWDDVLEKLPAALFEDFHANASFWMRRATFFSLLTAKDSQNKYQIGNQINFFNGENLSMNILGYKVLFDAGMPAVADGALAVGFGDLEQGYLIAERMGFAIHRDESDATKVKLTGRKRQAGSLRNGQAIKLLAIQ